MRTHANIEESFFSSPLHFPSPTTTTIYTNHPVPHHASYGSLRPSLTHTLSPTATDAPASFRATLRPTGAVFVTVVFLKIVVIVVCVLRFSHTYTNIHTYTYIHIHIYSHTHKKSHTHTYKHVYIHTYIHIHLSSLKFRKFSVPASRCKCALVTFLVLDF